MQKAQAERAPYVFMVAQKIPRGKNKIIKIKKRGGAFLVPVAIENRPDFGDQPFKDLACYCPFKSIPGIAAVLIVNLSCLVQALAIRLG